MRHAPAIILLLFTLLAGAPLHAEGRLVYRLTIKPPETTADSARVALNFVDIARERLSDRLKAAGVKEFEVRAAGTNTLLVETGWDHPRPWMVALLTATGKLDVRPILEPADWMAFARTLPEGVELRGDPAYLWSARRKPLETFLERIAFADREVRIARDGSGFRTVTTGESVGSNSDIADVSTKTSARGTPFVSIDFRSAVAARLAARGVSDVQKVAVILDGEVIGFVPAKAFTDQERIRVSVPDGAVANSRDQRDLWVRQVAGRLAAPLPIPIAVLKE